MTGGAGEAGGAGGVGGASQGWASQGWAEQMGQIGLDGYPYGKLLENS